MDGCSRGWHFMVHDFLSTLFGLSTCVFAETGISIIVYMGINVLFVSAAIILFFDLLFSFPSCVKCARQTNICAVQTALRTFIHFAWSLDRGMYFTSINKVVTIAHIIFILQELFKSFMIMAVLLWLLLEFMVFTLKYTGFLTFYYSLFFLGAILFISAIVMPILWSGNYFLPEILIDAQSPMVYYAVSWLPGISSYFGFLVTFMAVVTTSRWIEIATSGL